MENSLFMFLLGMFVVCGFAIVFKIEARKIKIEKITNSPDLEVVSSLNNEISIVIDDSTKKGYVISKGENRTIIGTCSVIVEEGESDLTILCVDDEKYESYGVLVLAHNADNNTIYVSLSSGKLIEYYDIDDVVIMNVID